MIQDKMNGNDPIQLKDSTLQLKSSPNNSDQEEDLNKLDDYELDKRKAEMDKRKGLRKTMIMWIMIQNSAAHGQDWL